MERLIELSDTAATEAPLAITFIVTLLVFALMWSNFGLCCC